MSQSRSGQDRGGRTDNEKLLHMYGAIDRGKARRKKFLIFTGATGSEKNYFNHREARRSAKSVRRLPSRRADLA
jgi:hypothetical protein